MFVIPSLLLLSFRTPVVTSNDLRLIKQSPFVSWIYTALSKPGAVYIILVVMQLGGVAMAVLAAMDLAELGYHVAMTYFAVECTLMVTVINACGLSLVRTIDSSLANRPSSAAETKGGRRIMTARDVQDARLATVRQHIKYMVVFLFVMTPTVILLLLLGTATAYGRGSPLLFFGMPMGLVPTIWFEINLLLHSPKKSAPSRLVALMKLGWSSFRLAAHQSRGASGYFSPDTALGDTKRLSSSESEGQYGKRGVVVPTENGPVCAAVRSGDAARLNT